jgi:uncharacterized sporulation protein YeaH/YhbH (DUF444 family)
MSFIVDRRPTGSTGASSKKKLMERVSDLLKSKVREDFQTRSVSDVTGRSITIPKGLRPPRVGHESPKDDVVINNDQFGVGDKIWTEQGGGGRGAGEQGDVTDEMEIYLSPAEYFSILFDGVELPDLIKRTESHEDVVLTRAGFTKSGVPSNLNMVRTLKQSMVRKKLLTGVFNEELDQLEKKKELEGLTEEEEARLLALLEKKSKLAFIDEVDLRYNNREEQPKPNIKAVVFFLMDCSGSMGEDKVELAKRFFTLVYMLIRNKYKTVQPEFILYAGNAQRVNEKKFFGTHSGGGTVTSTAYELVDKLWKEEYGGDWNGYIMHSSDGDNHPYDDDKLMELVTRLARSMQAVGYMEVGMMGENTLHQLFTGMAIRNLKVESATEESEVLPAFQNMFRRKRDAGES